MPNVDPNLIAELNHLRQSVTNEMTRLDQKEQKILMEEQRLSQGLLANTSAQNMQSNIQRNMGNWLVPGNVGDINKVTWGFWFPTQLAELQPNTSSRVSFSVTQEAGFIWMNYSKVVYILDEDDDTITYIDPDADLAGAPGLSYIIRDAQSSREFFNIPQNINTVGNPRWPTTLPTPQYFLPNSTVEVNFFNDHPTNIYVAGLIFYGERVRSEYDKNLLSTVYG